jgi:hypothetical protein
MVGRYTLEQALAIYKVYRAKIVAEDQLINHRVTWMLAAEATTFAIWGALALPDRLKGAQGSYVLGAALFVVSAIGICVAVVSYRSIDAACREMRDVKTRYKNAHKDLWDANDVIPRLHSDDRIFRDGLGFGRLMPAIFIFMNVSAMIYVIITYFVR